MEWWQVLNIIKDFLEAQGVSDFVFEGLSDVEGIDMLDKSLVCVTRATETFDSIYNRGEGKVTLYIDMFVSYDSPNMGDGYNALNELEKRVYDAIQSWATQDLPSEKIEIMEVKIKDAGGNLEVRRPIIGSYLTLEVNWSKRTI